MWLLFSITFLAWKVVGVFSTNQYTDALYRWSTDYALAFYGMKALCSILQWRDLSFLFLLSIEALLSGSLQSHHLHFPYSQSAPHHQDPLVDTRVNFMIWTFSLSITSQNPNSQATLCSSIIVLAETAGIVHDDSRAEMEPGLIMHQVDDFLRS